MATAKTTKTAQPQPPQASTLGATRQVLQVTARRDGFRRAGREWHGTTTVPIDELTVPQYEQLTGEPMLVTLLLEMPAEQVGELSGSAEDAAA